MATCRHISGSQRSVAFRSSTPTRHLSAPVDLGRGASSSIGICCLCCVTAQPPRPVILVSRFLRWCSRPLLVGNWVSVQTPGQLADGEKAEKGPWRNLLAFLAGYPFVVITLALGLPALVPGCWRWLRFRSGLIGPVVQIHQEKRLLIVGALGSGTAQMSAALMRLGVEVGHETSDSSNEPCRDGTVSWVHGIRFLSGTPNLSQLCAGSRRPAYSSTMFQPSGECSSIFSVSPWSQCWADECRRITAREYGCALRQKEAAVTATAATAATAAAATAAATISGVKHEASRARDQGGKRVEADIAPAAAVAAGRGGFRDEWNLRTITDGAWLDDGQMGGGRRHGGQHECGTPFRHSLLQVRHPLRTVTLLAYKSATHKEAAGVDCTAGRQHLIAVASLFPDKFVRTKLGGDERGSGRGGSDGLSDFEWARSGACVQKWAWYWVIYNRAMLDGVDQWYRVEDTPPSKVAVMAGFSGVAIDEAVQAAEQEGGPAKGALEGSNTSSLGGFEVTWDDIATFPGGLLREMSDLAVELGYEGAPRLPPKRSEQREAEAGEVKRREGWRGVFGGWGKQHKKA